MIYRTTCCHRNSKRSTICIEDPTLIDERTTPEAKLVNITIPGYAIK